jgi:hypothetical protein
MKTLDLKRGIQGEYIGSASLIDEVVNNDDFGPSLHLDFEEVGQLAYAEQDGESQYQRTMQLLDAVCARASRATNIEWDFSNGGVVGALTEVGSNAVRWNGEAGLFEEAASTNEIRNPRCEGAVVGDISGAGSLPTNWDADVEGATVSVVRTSYINGSPSARIRFSGTPTGDPVVWFEATDGIAALTAEDWTAAVGVALQAGDLTNVTGLKLRIQELTSGGAEVVTEDVDLDQLDALHRRFFLSHTLDGGGTVAAVRFGILVDWDGSGAIDLTLDLFTPQAEEQTAPTSPILPPIGSPATSTRAAETVTALASVARLTRKSNAGAWDFTNGGTVGAYREFRADQPAITKRGLLVEEGSTNQIRNPRAEGTAAGTPGTAPTNWQIGAQGTTTSIVGSGYENGWRYIDVRWNGTPTSDPFVAFEDTTQVTASQGQIWTQSAGVKMVAGDMTNTSGLRFTTVEYTGAGAFISAQDATNFTPVSAHRRYHATATLAEATVGAVRPALEIDWDGSGAIDITLRIYAPQLEQKAYPTSPILPPAGTLAESTREKDLISVANGPWTNTDAQTVYVEAQITNGSATSNNRRLVELNHTGVGSYSALYMASNGEAAAISFDSSANQYSFASGDTYSAGSVLRVAVAAAEDDAAASYSGGALQDTDSSVTPVSAAFEDMFIGNTNGGGRAINGYIKQLRYAPRRAPNAELETLVGN